MAPSDGLVRATITRPSCEGVTRAAMPKLAASRCGVRTLGGAAWATSRPPSRSTISSAKRAASVRSCMMATTTAPASRLGLQHARGRRAGGADRGRRRARRRGAPARGVGERPGEQHAGPFAAGQFGGGAALEPAQARRTRWRQRPPRVRGGRGVRLLAMGQAAERHDARDRQRPGDVPFCGRYAMAFAPRRPGCICRRSAPFSVTVPRCGSIRPARRSQQGGLAGAVRADHHREAARLERQVDLAQRLAASEPNRHAGGKGGSRGNLRRVRLSAGRSPRGRTARRGGPSARRS